MKTTLLSQNWLVDLMRTWWSHGMGG